MRGDTAAQVLANYLMTGPSSNMIGMYYLPIDNMKRETGMSEAEIRRCLVRFAAMQWAWYDEEEEVVFIRRMVVYQVGDKLTFKDKNATAVRRELARWRRHRFAASFYDLYAESHLLVGHFQDILDGFSPNRTAAKSLDPATPLPDPSAPELSHHFSGTIVSQIQQTVLPTPPSLESREGVADPSPLQGKARQGNTAQHSARAREPEPGPIPDLPSDGPEPELGDPGNPNVAVLAELGRHQTIAECADRETVEVLVGRMLAKGKTLAMVLAAIAEAAADTPPGEVYASKRQRLRKYVDNARRSRVDAASDDREPDRPSLPPPRPMVPPMSATKRMAAEALAKASGDNS